MSLRRSYAAFRRSVAPFLRLSVAQSLPLALVLGLWLLAEQNASAQVIRRCPQSTAAMLSNQIYADARMLINLGVARKLHAEAASMEMDNAVKWVNTYFERRRLNSEARAAENPSYLDKSEKRQQTYRRIHEKSLLPLNSDLSDDLNWMLREILANTSFAEFMSDTPNSMISSEHNAELTTAERHQIWLTEGKLAGEKAIKIRADTAEVLEANWPPVLRDKKFQAARKAFENAREWAIAELKNDKELTEKGAERLMAAVDRLTAELTAEYPRERFKTISPRDWLDYDRAKRRLQELAGSIYRLIETNSAVAFDDSYRFQGKSVAELLQHMMSRGLEFAPADPGGEAAYKKLYNSVRGFYLQLVPDPNKQLRGGFGE
ncbi:MAG TPA: hypothetical protein VND64_31335 [Pirellulales bacterium]|nr:hypothetical protein [Pirellulales bacterium]